MYSQQLSGYLRRVAETNIEQRAEEGVDVAPFRRRLAELGPGASEALQLISDVEEAPVRDDYPYTEPSDLASIRALTSASEPIAPPDEKSLRDKILGGWLGRAGGCLLGKPIEGTPLGHKKEEVRRHLEHSGLWPIVGYIDSDRLIGKVEHAPQRPFEGMARDDDIDYVILNLLLVESAGVDWTHGDARNIWTRYLAPGTIYAAGKAALANFGLGLMPPQTATWGNPCRQSLGAMIRCDTCGWVCPGDPARASELACRDAVISQTSNGIYVGMFFAAMIAGAFVESDIPTLIETGLSQIPPNSRLAEAVRFTVDAWNESRDWEPAIDRVYERYSQLYFNHSIINACIVLIGLLSGNGDFGRTIIDTVRCGFDTDCTGATAGSIAGVILGASRLPDEWVGPLHDSYDTWLAGLGPQRFSDLAARTAEAALLQRRSH